MRLLAAIVLVCSVAAADTAPDSVICVLFDLSQSAKDVRAGYNAGFGEIVDQLKGGDEVLGAGVTANSLATGKFEIRGDLPKYSPFLDSRLSYPKKLQAARKSLKDAADALLRKPATQTTDLLGAMQLVQKAFGGSLSKSAKARRLVIFSDMIEESDRYNFQRDRLTPARIAAILNEERKSGRMPDLHGVEVWVAGAGGANRDTYLRIQDFWIQYFKSAGASLQTARYGATLMDFRAE